MPSITITNIQYNKQQQHGAYRTANPTPHLQTGWNVKYQKMQNQQNPNLAHLNGRGRLSRRERRNGGGRGRLEIIDLMNYWLIIIDYSQCENSHSQSLKHWKSVYTLVRRKQSSTQIRVVHWISSNPLISDKLILISNLHAPGTVAAAAAVGIAAGLQSPVADVAVAGTGEAPSLRRTREQTETKAIIFKNRITVKPPQ